MIFIHIYVMKITVFWDVTLCTVSGTYQCFRETSFLSTFRVEAKHGKKEKKNERSGIDTGYGTAITLNKSTGLIGRSQEQRQRILTFAGPFSRDQLNGEIMAI
jgi:hypothetical protein